MTTHSLHNKKGMCFDLKISKETEYSDFWCPVLEMKCYKTLITKHKNWDFNLRCKSLVPQNNNNNFYLWLNFFHELLGNLPKTCSTISVSISSFSRLGHSRSTHFGFLLRSTLPMLHRTVLLLNSSLIRSSLTSSEFFEKRRWENVTAIDLTRILKRKVAQSFWRHQSWLINCTQTANQNSWSSVSEW